MIEWLPSWPACSTHPVDWNDASHELAQREPRRGRRLTLAARVHAEQRPPLLVYSVHLEVLLTLVNACAYVARLACSPQGAAACLDFIA